MSVIELINANALSIPLADESCHMVVTSPPYYALRDYKTNGQLGLEKRADCLGWATGDVWELRPDLTDEEIVYVYRELIKAGILNP